MHAVTAPIENDAPADGTLASKPQVRTLLLTDLCDSTLLVERLGDAAAAELFREHDRLVLGLQQRWHGRLIDRSDGLLLLFERAIDGLGFALDYARGLRDIGERRKLARQGVELHARSGLHVGEVLTWRNSDAAVSFGAKPLEVEGLAKPMAGRLMTLARPGQILLSATAEPLAHRASRELGEHGEQLVWKSWGRWRFKGVPQAQEVCEVGEPDIAPLRAPQQIRGKAWRDIPLWRRPAALAAELLLVAGLATGGWFLTRPQPAIAFGERDWVVVADLRNLTGDTLLDESLQQAFRISLEQSRYVNVLSDLKARDTLRRMRRDPDSTLDRAIASEIALRDGARAVILPTVAEVGGRVRVSAEVIDPHTQTTVYAESADGSGASSTLGSIDEVTAALRGRLGEAMESIQRDSVPLPKVSTANLDALKSFAVARSLRNNQPARALVYYQRAEQLDPSFALAKLETGTTLISKLANLPAGKAKLEEASRLRDRLTPREALQVDATLARFGPPAPALEKWKQLVTLYPDQLDAHIVLSQLEMWDGNRFDRALSHARAAQAPQATGRAIAQYLEGIVLVGMERPDEAIEKFSAARAGGYMGAGFSYAYASAVRRDWAGVEKVLSQRVNTGRDSGEVELPEQRAVFAVDRGEWDDALRFAADAETAAMAAEPVVLGREERIRRLAVQVLAARESRDALVSRIEEEVAALAAVATLLDAQDPTLRPSMLHALGYLAARLDAEPVLGRIVADAGNMPLLGQYPMVEQMQRILEAELQRIRGDARGAVAALETIATADDAMVPAHSALLRAALAAGDLGVARGQGAWLEQHRGRAYVERSANDLLLAVNVADTTRLPARLSTSTNTRRGR